MTGRRTLDRESLLRRPNHSTTELPKPYLQSARRGQLPNLTEVAKNTGKDAFRGFKVIQGHRVRHQSKGHM